MQNKKNNWSVTMVNSGHIASKKYPGCATTRSVQNFCSRYKVNWFWWRPPNSTKKIMMIDLQNFWHSYNEVFGNYWKTNKPTSSRSVKKAKTKTTKTRKVGTSWSGSRRTYSTKGSTPKYRSRYAG